IDIGSAVSRTNGTSAEKIAALPNYRNSELFSGTEKLVLEYADGMTQTPVEVPDALFAKLREKFTGGQLLRAARARGKTGLESSGMNVGNSPSEFSREGQGTSRGLADGAGAAGHQEECA